MNRAPGLRLKDFRQRVVIRAGTHCALGCTSGEPAILWRGGFLLCAPCAGRVDAIASDAKPAKARVRSNPRRRRAA